MVQTLPAENVNWITCCSRSISEAQDSDDAGFQLTENDVKLTSCGRSCLNFGFLGFHGFQNNKTNETECSQYRGE